MLADWDATILELRAIWAARCGRQRETSHRLSGDMIAAKRFRLAR